MGLDTSLYTTQQTTFMLFYEDDDEEEILDKVEVGYWRKCHVMIDLAQELLHHKGIGMREAREHLNCAHVRICQEDIEWIENMFLPNLTNRWGVEGVNQLLLLCKQHISDGKNVYLWNWW